MVTDHKPLEVVFNKPAHSTSVRVQRIVDHIIIYIVAFPPITISAQSRIYDPGFPLIITSHSCSARFGTLYHKSDETLLLKTVYSSNIKNGAPKK